MATIGTRILELIKDRGMSQKEFSEKTGIPQSTISDWRGKKINPGSEKIMKICEILDVSPQDLLTGENTSRRTSVDYVYIDKNSPEFFLIEGYRKLETCDKMRLEGYLEALLNTEK